MKKIFILGFALFSTTLSMAQKIQTERMARIITTAENTPFRLSETATLAFAKQGQPFETEPAVFVDPSKTFQEFLGIGGALTDAAAETFAKLPADKQQAFLRAYYDREEGIGYSMARTNINSCDFSSDVYTYVEEGDRELKTFSIAHDMQFKIPFIRQAFAASGNELILFASPWSPPAWMKDNRNMLQGGKLMPEFFDSWANYFVKFIHAYREAGIPVWAITVQNEPMAKQTWESCIYTADEERDFIKNHLGPVLWKNDLKELRLIAWDHNRDLIYHRASTILNDPDAAKYVWGIGFHWYESWTGAPIPENVARVNEAFPEYKTLLTEACNYPFSWDTFDEWHWGEKYGWSMIHDFNNGACGWTDWNILLDETGGPNHVGNFCFAPIHADTRDGSLHFMNSYHYIGHFSKFIRPGAKRIACSSSRAQLLATGFLNPDGSMAVVVMNQGDTPVLYKLFVQDQAIELESVPHSIVTVLF
jgi:glucosylceramidase